MKSRINWKIFEGSSHSVEALALFSLRRIKTYEEFEDWFLPCMKEQAREVDKMRRNRRTLAQNRISAGRAFKRFELMTPREAGYE